MNSVTGSAILQIMDLAGQKAVQLVKNRIQSSGKNATDNRFFTIFNRIQNGSKARIPTSRIQGFYANRQNV